MLAQDVTTQQSARTYELQIDELVASLRNPDHPV